MEEIQKLEVFNYKIKESARRNIKDHGSVKKAITFLEIEYTDYEKLWSRYSSDCLAHAMNFNEKMIKFLKQL